MSAQHFVVDPDGVSWMVFDENSGDDQAFAVCKGPGSEGLARRIADALNAQTPGKEQSK